MDFSLTNPAEFSYNENSLSSSSCREAGDQRYLLTSGILAITFTLFSSSLYESELFTMDYEN